MKTSKFLSITTLAILSLLLTAFTWAFWSSNVSGNTTNKANTVTLGQANTATTEVSLTDASATPKALVPPTRSKDSVGETVESVEYVFDVKWSSELSNTANGTVGTLSVTNTGNTFADLADQYGIALVSFNTNNVEIIADDSKAVRIVATVTLREPDNKEQYDFVAAKVLKSNFEFSVTPKDN